MAKSSRALALSLAAALLACTFSERRARAESPALVARRDDHLTRQHALLGYFTGVSALSLAGGAALLFTDPPPFAGRPKDLRLAFAAMNLAYGVANTAFTIASFAGIQHQRESLTSPWLLAEDRRRQARALGMHAGLDMIYVTLGLTLWATDKRPIAQGVGLAIALQGAMVMAFDGGGAFLMSR